MIYLLQKQNKDRRYRMYRKHSSAITSSPVTLSPKNKKTHKGLNSRVSCWTAHTFSSSSMFPSCFFLPSQSFFESHPTSKSQIKYIPKGDGVCDSDPETRSSIQLAKHSRYVQLSPIGVQLVLEAAPRLHLILAFGTDACLAPDFLQHLHAEALMCIVAACRVAV